MKYQFKVLCGAVALAMSGQILAASTWTLGSDYGTISSGVTVSAYANTGGTNNAANAANNGALQTIQNAAWTSSYGGITNADNCASSFCDVNEGINPEHAIDNEQRYDMALLSFTSAVKLTDLKLGWVSGDSDVTVMAYTGLDPFTLSSKLTGKTYAQLVSLGWTSIGNYTDVGQTTAKPINAGGFFSSYWLIGAYNPLTDGSTGISVGNDFVKLASVTGCISGTLGCTPVGRVPEPGSLALFGLGLLGMLTLRKRQQT